MNINEFILKDVRCFDGEQRVRLAPLTFLVGENSTGKSTFLGCYHALYSSLKMRPFPLMSSESPNFNIPPYEMGSFSEIVRRKKDTFELGFHGSLEEDKLTILIRYSAQGSEASIEQINFIFTDIGNIIFRHKPQSQRITNKKKQIVNNITIDNNTYYIDFDDNISILSFQYIVFNLNHTTESDDKEVMDSTTSALESKIRKLVKFIRENNLSNLFLSSIERVTRPIINISPIRSRPERTYNPLTEDPTPEGSDAPMYLMRLKREKKETELQQALADFGNASGMFEKISVKTYGKQINEPFQLQIKVRGGNANILDVGYGVSQLLPILVRTLTDSEPATIVLQQPEVHLHPRGQAELSSLFISAIDKRRKNFIVETHSDYMIDRTRIEIRAGKIKSEDVSLVYFEPIKNKVKIHNIKFDATGNMIDVPIGYRNFFLREGDRLLGFED